MDACQIYFSPCKRFFLSLIEISQFKTSAMAGYKVVLTDKDKKLWEKYAQNNVDKTVKDCWAQMLFSDEQFFK